MTNGSAVEEDYLFSPSLLAPFSDPELAVRPLHIDDYKKGNWCLYLSRLTSGQGSVTFWASLPPLVRA